MIDKKDFIGISIFVLIALLMLFAWYALKFEKTGAALGDHFCGDSFCDDGETIEDCPVDCGAGCGNDVIEQDVTYASDSPNGTTELIVYNETCDGTNLGNKGCSDFGFTAGTLSCSDTCIFDVSLCYNSNSSCGNNICDMYESNTECPSDCECSPGEGRLCGLNSGICEPGLQICNTSSRWGLCIADMIPQNETCNNIDDDCDGLVDEGFDWNNNDDIDNNETFDYDDDGYYPRITITHDSDCTGYDEDEYDCNDMNSSIHPYSIEKLNKIDDDCDGLVDEGITEVNQSITIEKVDLGILKKEGSKAYLRTGDWATFKINDIYGKIEIKNISEKDALLSVSTITKDQIRIISELSLRSGSTQQFDLDKDGKNDVSLKLDDMQSNFKVFLTLKDISELLSPLPCDEDGVCDSGENVENCPTDCFFSDPCNHNGVCDGDETLQNCFEDCQQDERELEQIFLDQQVDQPNDCNNDLVCDPSETVESCPDDCKSIEISSLNNLKNIKNILIYSGIVILVLTLTSGSFVVKNRLDPYKVKKDIKKDIVRAIDLGYNLDSLTYYLNSKKIKPGNLRKSIKYAADFMALKQAIVFYIAQGHSEDEVRKICKKNKWSHNITKEVFDDVHSQQRELTDAKRNPASMHHIPQRDGIGGFKRGF